MSPVIFPSPIGALARGVIFIIFGISLLLYTLGVLTNYLQYILVAGAIASLSYGIFLLELHKSIMNLLTNK